MPTHGRRDSLVRVLRALDRQTAPPDLFEVVVVCDGDVDDSHEACARLQGRVSYRLRAVVQDNQGPAAARNRGIAEAGGKLIIFLDDDVVPEAGLVAAHLERQRGHSRRVVIGPLLSPLDARLNLWGLWEEHTLCRQYDAMTAGRWAPTCRQFYTGNASAAKETIAAVGGFDPAYKRAEDVELAVRLQEHGAHFVFAPEARGRHYIQRPFGSWLRTPAAYGAADVRMAQSGHPGLLGAMVKEFPKRSRLVRALSLAMAGRPARVYLLTAALGAVVRAADALRVTRVGLVACSLLFNVRYYDGVATALGGMAAFRRLLMGTPMDEVLPPDGGRRQTDVVPAVVDATR